MLEQPAMAAKLNQLASGNPGRFKTPYELICQQ